MSSGWENSDTTTHLPDVGQGDNYRGGGVDNGSALRGPNLHREDDRCHGHFGRRGRGGRRRREEREQGGVGANHDVEVIKRSETFPQARREHNGRYRIVYSE